MSSEKERSRTHDDQLKRLVIEHELAIDGHQYTSVNEWASAELTSDAPHQLAYDLLESSCDTHATLAEIARDRFEFDPLSAEGDRIVGQLVCRYLKQFLAQELTPFQLCQLISQIDSYYVDHVRTEHPTPRWVSDLWNACDWCDDSWTHATAPHLVEDAQRLLQELDPL